MNRHAYEKVVLEIKTNRRQSPVQIVRIPTPNEKITNVP